MTVLHAPRNAASPAPDPLAAGSAVTPRTLASLLDRPGTRVVLVALSRDENPKATLLVFPDGAAVPRWSAKVPLTDGAVAAVEREGRALSTLDAVPLGRVRATVPHPSAEASHGGRPVLVTTALPGRPMSVGYHSWHHTAHARHVNRDLGSAGRWLAAFQDATAQAPAPVRWAADIADALDTVGTGQRAARVRRHLRAADARMARLVTPRTAVHGDFWFGNVLTDGSALTGVVDWEWGAPRGEPMRDVARFVLSYALYLDRHTRPGARVSGHRGLRADGWGAGLRHLWSGSCWCRTALLGFVSSALARLGAGGCPVHDVLATGIAEVAATSDHADFAAAHLDLLAALLEADA